MEALIEAPAAAAEGAASEYVRAVDALWQYFYGREAGETMPFAISNGAGLDLERSRRWSNVATAMTSAVPLTAFFFLARSGTDGVKAFLRSDEWQLRETDRGVVFPHGDGLKRALIAFFGRWRTAQEPWICELARAELDLIGASARPSAAAREAGLVLAPGLQAVCSALDVPGYLATIHRARQRLPWDLVLDSVRPVARPVVVVQFPDGKQVVLRDESALQAAWLLEPAAVDPFFAVAAQRPSEAFVEKLRARGILCP